MSRTTALVLAAGMALPAALAPAAWAREDKAALPLTAITLYRSGVGSFQRDGLIEGDAQVQLRFTTDQINDILKSMVLLDLDGGRIAGVSYASKEPLERRLASFGINIADDPSTARLLGRLRGAPVRVATPDGDVTGTVLGVETRPVAAGEGEKAVIQVPFLNLVTDTGIRSIDLTTIGSFDLLDKDLAAELGKALTALAEHRADRTKAVDITLDGEGARRIVVAYIHEMPVWKTSYRLVLPDPGPGRARGSEAERHGRDANEGGVPTIQGWAIVENTTDEDWQNVRLSLVAGRPVSFEMDLYEPLFLDRPDVPVPVVAGATPRVYEGGQAFGDRARLGQIAAGVPGAPPATARSTRGPGRLGDARLGYAHEEAGKALELDAAMMAEYAAQARARGGDVGEVFHYQLETPVTIERQRSAMLPILSAGIDGRRVSIYNRLDGAEHPMRGVELTNTTGLQLMPGPISVYDAGSYAGDAQIGHVPAGDKRLLSYAVDLDVRAVVRDDSTSEVRHLRIVDGLIHQTIKQVNTVAYAFTNTDDRDRTILVEHPKQNGWDLVEPEEPYEQTDDLYRFEVAVDAGRDAALTVRQERTHVQTVAVASFDLPTLLAYSRQGKASPEVVEAVRTAAAMQAAINDLERRIGRLDEERKAIDADQSRIRQNMSTVSRDTDLYRRYMTKLNEQETRLEQLTTERAAAQAELVAKQRELNDYLRDLDVD